MNRGARWTLVIAGPVVAVILIGAVAFAQFISNDQVLTSRLARAAEAHLGVKVLINSAHVRLWPRPQLVVEHAATVQSQPIRVDRLIAIPRLSELVHGHLVFAD